VPIKHATIPGSSTTGQVGYTQWNEDHTLPTLTDLGIPGLASATNGGNGYDFSVSPQVSTGAYAVSENLRFSYQFSTPIGTSQPWGVGSFGINSKPFSGVATPATDPFGLAYFLERAYGETAEGESAMTGGSTTTIVKSAAGWAVNQWVGYYARNMTPGKFQRAEITSNDATTLNFAAMPVANANLDTFIIEKMIDEIYPAFWQYGQTADIVGVYTRNRGIRPFMYTFNAGGAKYSEPLTIVPSTGVTAGSTTVVTTTTPHYLQVGSYVHFATMVGGGWTALNLRGFAVTAVGSNVQFTVSANSSGFTGFTSGRVFRAPEITSYMLGGRANGWQMVFPSMVEGTVTDDLAVKFLPGRYEFWDANDAAQTSLVFQTRAGSGRSTQNIFTFSGVQTAALTSNALSTWGVRTYNSSGASERQALTIKRLAVGGGSNVTVSDAYTGLLDYLTLFAVDGTNTPSGTRLLRMAQRASPGFSEHVIQVTNNDDSAIRFCLDGEMNLVTRVTAMTTTTATGFPYAPYLSGNHAGTTPTRTEPEYANSVPFFFQNNGGTYTLRAYINDGWRTVALT
jgi:hypothetical protein